MPAGDEYRARAAEFLAKAQSEADPTRFMEFAKLAAAYQRLADQADRNDHADLVYESAPAMPPGGDEPAAGSA